MLLKHIGGAVWLFLAFCQGVALGQMEVGHMSKRASHEGAGLGFEWVDLRKFERNPILTPSGADWDQEWFCACDVIRWRGRYLLYYEARPRGTKRRQIGLAFSDDGLRWNPSRENPVLKIGPPGSWESSFVGDARVLQAGEELWMYYIGHDGRTERIGLATSRDGVHWMKHPLNPILRESSEGWDRHHVMQPAVVRLSQDLWYMWFSSYGPEKENHQTGIATSSDGVRWQKDPRNPVLRLGPAESWDSVAAFGVRVLLKEGVYHMLYTGAAQTARYRIGYAFSKDGLHWEKYGGNPILPWGEPDSWDCRKMSIPIWLPIEDDRYRIYYSGDNGVSYLGVGGAEGRLTAISRRNEAR